MATIRTRIQFRRDAAANWLLYKDVTPAAGEPCFEIDTGVFKIGDGITTYENLKDIGGACLSADGKSIVIEDGVLKLAGFDLAEVGAQPRKNAEGNIEWVVSSTDTVDGLQTTVAGLQSDVTKLQSNVASIQEIVGSSEEGAGTLLDRVAAIEDKVGDTSVASQIETAINALKNGDIKSAVDRIAALETDTHTHTNKVELDKIAEGDKAKWDTAANKSHEHDNKVELDKFVDGDKAKLDTAVQSVTAGTGLTATKTGTDVAIGFDDSVVFVFDCGDSSI